MTFAYDHLGLITVISHGADKGGDKKVDQVPIVNCHFSTIFRHSSQLPFHLKLPVLSILLSHFYLVLDSCRSKLLALLKSWLDGSFRQKMKQDYYRSMRSNSTLLHPLVELPPLTISLFLLKGTLGPQFQIALMYPKDPRAKHVQMLSWINEVMIQLL